MELRRTFIWLVFTGVLTGLFGCAYPISQIYRKQTTRDLTFAMVRENPQAYVGSIVIWGGKILQTVNESGFSELTLLEMPLDYEGKPEGLAASEGRFIAKMPEFLDPEIYQKGRRITLAGEVAGEETRALGKAEYVYPVVVIKQIYLWQKSISTPLYFGYPSWDWSWYDPFFLYPYPYLYPRRFDFRGDWRPEEHRDRDRETHEERR